LGTLIISGAGTLGASNGAVTLSGGTLDLGGGNRTVGVVSITNGPANGIGNTIQNGNLTATSYAASNTSNATVPIITANLLGTGNFTKSGGGIATLAGANTYSGGTTISAGVLSLSGSGTLGATTGNLTLYGGTLDLGGSSQTVGAVTITTAAGSGYYTIQNGNLTGASYTANNPTGIAEVTANLLGSAGLTKLAAGTLVLAGNNAFSGNTSITANGILDLDSTLALGGSTLTTTGITFDPSLTGHAFTFGGLSGSFNLALNDLAPTPNAIALSVGNNNTNTTYSGILSGNGTLTKIGTGNLSLSGTNSYTGATTVANGTLYAGATNTLSSNSAVTVSGGTLDVSAYANTVKSLALSSGSLNLNIANLLTATGNASFGGGTINVSGTATAGNYTLITAAAVTGTLGSTAGTIPTGYRLGIAGSALDLFHEATVTLAADATNNTNVRTGTATFGVNIANTAPSGSDAASYNLAGALSGNGSLTPQATATHTTGTYTAATGINTNTVTISNTGSNTWANTPGNVTITQTAYDYANPTVGNVAFSIVHVGDVVSQPLAVTNATITNASYQDNLSGCLSSVWRQ